MGEIKPYVTWNVKDEEYKLKLTTSSILKLEERFKGNLMGMLTADTVPSLNAMFLILHGGMGKYHHGIKLKDIEKIYDDYLEEDGDQTSLLTDVIVPIFACSGFFKKAQAEEILESMKSLSEETD